MYDVTQSIALWPGAAPGSEQATYTEAEFRDVNDAELRIRNVVVPTLTPFLPEPDLSNGTSVIVAPGGGYRMLSWESEGVDVATWLAQRGVTAFVLKYRLVDTGRTDDDFQQSMADFWSEHIQPAGSPRVIDLDTIAPGIAPLAAEDGKQAVRIVRQRAAESGLRTDAVGVIGFSAGGFVAMATAVAADASARPDFVAPIYGASFNGRVPDDAPPLFCVVAADDALCFDGCMSTFESWRAAGRPAELHVYGEGGHGFGARKRGLPVDTWLDRLADWMQVRGYLERVPSS